MFYCNPCAEAKRWPESFLSKSVGPCEMCGKRAVCNDVPSSQLPPAAPPPELVDPATGKRLPSQLTIKDIVKERYETGAYGNAHLRMSSKTLTDMARALPERLRGSNPGWVPPPGFLGALTAIPVRLDLTLPDGTWRLVDNSTDEVIHFGSETGTFDA